jgi:hypothetical protein
MSDARFEDGVERPLRLAAETPEDLAVLSALAQDAVSTVADVGWMPRRRLFTLLVNRFRWEDAQAAERERRPFERVRALLSVRSALRVRSHGLDPADRDTVFSVLALEFAPGADGAGTLRILLAGDGEIAVDVECLDVAFADVARPHVALAGRAPAHKAD